MRRRLCGESAGDARIEPAAQIPSHRHIRAQAHRDATAHERVEFADRVGCFLSRLWVVEAVPRRHAQCAITPDGEVTWLELTDAAEGRAWRARAPRREDLVETDGVRLGAEFAGGEERLGFGGESEHTALDGVEERTHTKAIPDQDHATGTALMDREGELPVEPIQEARSPLLPAVHQDLGVTGRGEAMAERTEFRGELAMVVDLTVVGDDDGTVLVRHRLGTAGKIDDAEPHVRESHVRTGQETVAVRAAVTDRSSHARERVDCDSAPVRSRDAGDAAH